MLADAVDLAAAALEWPVSQLSPAMVSGVPTGPVSTAPYNLRCPLRS